MNRRPPPRKGGVLPCWTTGPTGTDVLITFFLDSYICLFHSHRGKDTAILIHHPQQADRRQAHIIGVLNCPEKQCSVNQREAFNEERGRHPYRPRPRGKNLGLPRLMLVGLRSLADDLDDLLVEGPEAVEGRVVPPELVGQLPNGDLEVYLLPALD